MEINFIKRLFIKRITCLLPVVFVLSLSSCKRNPVNMNAIEGAVKVNIRIKIEEIGKFKSASAMQSLQ
jgi:hypothetical protein